MMKRLDKFIFAQLVPPFLVAFFIAIFILILQFFWVYIDDIAGKGIGMGVITELIAYVSVTFFDEAILLGILISSVMTFGRLAENYELASIRSAGISLWRTLRPGVIFAVLLAILSYISVDFINPMANLKFRSRLYDIRKQRPALDLVEGGFSKDFEGFTIRINEKGRDNRTIKGVTVYDERNSGNQINIIQADSGFMYITDDKKFFVMNLFNGEQFQEVNRYGNRSEIKQPFMRTSFDRTRITFDLGDFSFSQTDEALFSGHHSMLSAKELRIKLDTIAKNQERIKADFQKDAIYEMDVLYPDEAREILKVTAKNKKKHNIKIEAVTTPVKSGYPLISSRVDSLPADSSLIYAIRIDDRIRVLSQAEEKSTLLKEQFGIRARQMRNARIEQSKHAYALHSKFSGALFSILFLFVGASMGTIVRKGGFGYPLLISVIFFVIYLMSSTACRKLADVVRLDGVWAAWLPLLAMTPLAIFLVLRASYGFNPLSSIFKYFRGK